MGVGNMNLGAFIGNILSSLYGGILSDRSIAYFARRNYGYFEPEMRLHMNHLPAVAQAGGILMFGITVSKVTGFAVSIIA